MKVLKVLKNIFLWIIGLTYFGFVIFMTVLLLNYNEFGVTQFGERSLLLINKPVSSEKYKKGDLVIVKSKSLKNIKVGEELFTYKLDANNKADIEFGTVGDVYKDEDAIAFENGDTYSMKFVIGNEEKIYNNIGTYLSIIESKWGFLFIVLVPSFIVFIYQIYSLIIEIKYGGQE